MPCKNRCGTGYATRRSPDRWALSVDFVCDKCYKKIKERMRDEKVRARIRREIANHLKTVAGKCRDDAEKLRQNFRYNFPYTQNISLSLASEEALLYQLEIVRLLKKADALEERSRRLVRIGF